MSLNKRNYIKQNIKLLDYDSEIKGEIGNKSFERVFKIYSKNMKEFVVLKAFHNDPTDFDKIYLMDLFERTPVEFKNLYSNAWDGNPDLRPTIKKKKYCCIKGKFDEKIRKNGFIDEGNEDTDEDDSCNAEMINCEP
ncbi:26038_t:CDS:2 [Gigaspora margarita]|uniref:26038_t:CDS:1 n=1 Tax=Gigaspora margarita TaxID=4874 RepID=A0ABM8VVU7_GIGMA|nr:26038_t:CDS:2 [Gigaspora margarita]